MEFSLEQLRYLAELSALDVSDEDLSELRPKLETILEYVGMLESAPTHGVEPTSHVLGTVNAFREDIAKESFTPEEVERLAKNFTPAGFRVPKII